MSPVLVDLTPHILRPLFDAMLTLLSIFTSPERALALFVTVTVIGVGLAVGAAWLIAKRFSGTDVRGHDYGCDLRFRFFWHHRSARDSAPPNSTPALPPPARGKRRNQPRLF